MLKECQLHKHSTLHASFVAQLLTSLDLIMQTYYNHKGPILGACSSFS